MKRWTRTLAAVLVLGLGLAACTPDEDEEPGEGKPGGRKRVKHKGRPAAAKSSPPASGPEADLRNALAARPSECEAGKNERKVLAVRVTKQEQNETGGSKYRKVRGEATIQESGPCADNAGKHRWAAGITYVEEDDSWRLASFGFDQQRLD